MGQYPAYPQPSRGRRMTESDSEVLEAAAQVMIDRDNEYKAEVQAVRAKSMEVLERELQLKKANRKLDKDSRRSRKIAEETAGKALEAVVEVDRLQKLRAKDQSELKALRQVLIAMETQIEELATTVQMTDIEKIHEVSKMREEISVLKKQLAREQNVNSENRADDEKYAQIMNRVSQLTKRLELWIQNRENTLEHRKAAEIAEAKSHEYRRATEAEMEKNVRLTAEVQKLKVDMMKSKRSRSQAEDEAYESRRDAASYKVEVPKLRTKINKLEAELKKAQAVKLEADDHARSKSEVKYLKGRLEVAQSTQRQAEDEAYKARQNAAKSGLSGEKKQSEIMDLKKKLSCLEVLLEQSEKSTERHRQTAQAAEARAQEHAGSVLEAARAKKQLKAEREKRRDLVAENSALKEGADGLRDEYKTLLEKYLKSGEMRERILKIIGDNQAKSSYCLDHRPGWSASLTNACKDLGVDQNASFTDIKSAYKKWARILHPDRLAQMGMEDEGNEEMQRVNNAYSLLEKHFNAQAERNCA